MAAFRRSPPCRAITCPPWPFWPRALADENRLRILLSLGNGRKPVSAIVEELGLSQPLVSHHLKELRRALLVTVERRGPFIYYGMSRPTHRGHPGGPGRTGPGPFEQPKNFLNAKEDTMSTDRIQQIMETWSRRRRWPP